MNNAVKITYATRDELYEVAAFLDECWKAAYQEIVASDFLGALSVDERYEKLLIRFDKGTSAFLIMRDGEKMIGASVFGQSFTEGYPGDGEVSAIYLRHDYIGKGYGHALFTKIERELAAKGYSYFVLDVLSANTRAVLFYEKHGYEKVDERSISLGAHSYPLTVLRKKNPFSAPDRHVTRCDWANQYPEYIPYHDTEWGRPVHDDRKLFEMLVLSCTQAGLSWITMLRRRENYRRAFDGFDVEKIASYDDAKLDELLQDAGIIRNRQKISAVIANARAFRQIQEEYGSFDVWLWSFADGKPIDDLHSRRSDVPVRTELSDKISAELKKRGFKFAGSTIVCAYMHTVGLMNGHARDCFCRTGEG